MSPAYPGRLIFDHLPKTAGQAVNAWLARELGPACVTPNFIGEHRKLIRRYGGDYSVISAHVAFDGKGLDPRYSYITLFREPIDRAISWLFFVTQNHTEKDLGDLYREASNFFATDGDESGPAFEPTIRNPYVEHFSSIFYSGPRSDEVKLQHALEAIEQYAAWGIYEDMPAFLADVSALIGIPTPSQFERVNVTKTRPAVEAISTKLRQRLEEINALDMALYSELCTRFKNTRKPRPLVVEPQASPWVPYAGVERRTFSAPGFNLVSVSMGGTPGVVRGHVLAFTVDFSLQLPVDELEIGIHIFDADSGCAFGTNTTLLAKRLLGVKRGSHRVQYFLIADLPEGRYTAGFAFTSCHADSNRELAWFDSLVEFSVKVTRTQAGVGYASLPVSVTCMQTSPHVAGLIEDASGTLAVQGLLSDVTSVEVFSLGVRLHNASDQSWSGTQRCPLYLSYHWLSQDGHAVVIDGERTALPVAAVRAGECVDALMRVVAPAEPGQYRLVLLPVQEGRLWFDSRGFTPTVLDLAVASAESPRRYLGADARLRSQCGERKDAALQSTGVEGFLVYGPYASLPAGRYVVTLEVSFAAGRTGAWMDIAADSGSNQLAKLELALPLTAGDEICLPFELTSPVTDLEVRLWLPAGAHCQIDALVISPAALFEGALETDALGNTVLNPDLKSGQAPKPEAETGHRMKAPPTKKKLPGGKKE